jgi:hypothetical protein
MQLILELLRNSSPEFIRIIVTAMSHVRHDLLDRSSDDAQNNAMSRLQKKQIRRLHDVASCLRLLEEGDPLTSLVST